MYNNVRRRVCETPNHAEKEPPRRLIIIIIIFTTQFIIVVVVVVVVRRYTVQNSCNPTPSSERNAQGQEGLKGVFTTVCAEAV